MLNLRRAYGSNTAAYGMVSRKRQVYAGEDVGMDYVVLRYRQQPEMIVEVAATTDAAEAVDLAQRWRRSGRDEGLIVAVHGHPIVHCAPRAA